MKKLKIVNFILTIAVMSFIIGYILNGMFYQKGAIDRSYNNMDNHYNYCVEHDPDDEYCAYIIANYGNKEKLTPDSISLYMETVISPKVHILNYILPILTIVPAIYSLCLLFKNRTIINIINRTDYKMLLKKVILGVYKFAFILPISVGIVILIAYFLMGHLDFSYAINTGMYGIFWFNMNSIAFTLLYLISLFLVSIFYINLGLIVLRKNHNIIIAIIESFLMFIGIDLFIEICSIIPSFFGFGYSPRFNILNILSAGFATNVYEMIIFPLVFAIISFVVVILLYKDKEKFIIDCEKNN